jgi:sporulation protein YlmC with PRC-barrel domain
MKSNDLYVLTLTSAAMLCGTVAVAQERGDGGQATASHSGATRSSGAVHATNLIGAIVKDRTGDSIGKIADLVVSSSANITTAVVSVGGVLGIGDKKIGIPYKNFSVSPDGKAVCLDMTAEQLKSRLWRSSVTSKRSSG